MIFILRGRRSICECWRVTFRDRRITSWHFRRWQRREMLYFTIQNRLQARTSQVSEAAGARWRFYRRMCSDYPRIILESSFYWRKHSGSFRWNLELQDFAAGAVFGEVAGSLYLLHALEMTFHMWRRSGMIFILRGRRSICECWRVTFRDRRSTSWHFRRWQRREMLYFTIQNRLQARTSQVSEAAGARWRFYRRMCSGFILGLSSNRLSIGGSIQGVSAEILSFKISWQAQYLVRLEGDFTCSTHWKWRFICDADQGWYSFCVAGAVICECWRVTFRDRRSTSWHFGR